MGLWIAYPIFPIHSTKTFWIIINIGPITGITYHLYLIKKQNRKPKAERVEDTDNE